MENRRTAIKILASTAAALPILGQEHAAHTAATTAVKYVPKVFDVKQLELLAELTERIIPRTDTPGAADVGVPLLIDRIANRTSESAAQWKEMLAWFAGEGQTPDQRLAVLQRISTETGTPGALYFKALKDATIDTYYATKAGLEKELDWHGNTFLPDYPGCTHPEHQISDKG